MGIQYIKVAPDHIELESGMEKFYIADHHFKFVRRAMRESAKDSNAKPFTHYEISWAKGKPTMKKL